MRGLDTVCNYTITQISTVQQATLTSKYCGFTIKLMSVTDWLVHEIRQVEDYYFTGRFY